MSNLNIRTETLFGTHHSWAITMRSIFNEFIKKGHIPFIKSINGYACVPDEWKGFLNQKCDKADVDICYTAPINFHSRFQKNSKLKLAIYNYETIPLPKIWGHSYKHVDYVLPSSNFSKEVFVEAGWPEKKCIVIPHGYNPENYNDKTKYNLINDKKFRFLNVSIPHYRKNISLVVDSYYSTFSKNDDVCLVLKTSLFPKNKKIQRFERRIEEELEKIQNKYIKKGRQKNDFPMIEVIDSKIESMITLYNACDVLISASSSEGFGLPLLEGLASDMVIIAPRCTGQLDFLNDKNSLLVDVEKIKATPQYQYWMVSDEAETFLPKKESLSFQMFNAYKNYQNLKNNFQNERAETLKKFTWENAVNKILSIK